MRIFVIQKRPKKPPRRPRALPRRPRTRPGRPQDAHKMPPKRPKTIQRRPETTPRRAQDGPRRCQDVPRRRRDGPRRLQDAQRRPKTAQEYPRMPKNAFISNYTKESQLSPLKSSKVLGGVFKAGVGGGVNPSPREEGKGMRPVQRAKPPQPRGLVGFSTRFFPIFIFWVIFLFLGIERPVPVQTGSGSCRFRFQPVPS